MTAHPPTVERLAARLDAAQLTGDSIEQLTELYPLDIDQAYAVQRAGIEMRTARGERVTGAKLGFTSRAKAMQMGVSDVIIGVLTDAMTITDGGDLELSNRVHPRVEPEVAFRLCADVNPGDTEALIAAVDAVAPALEVIDSRYRDFRFSLEDVVADNTSASGYVLGPWTRFSASDPAVSLSDQRVEMAFDRDIVATGSTADILGDPLAALPAAARMAALHGHRLSAGAVLLAGAATAAVVLQPHRLVTASVAGLGVVSLRTGGAAS